ncbi:deoxyribose-phosphate aldolase [Cytobacillus sp. Hz8]|uniref:deoxyribose-phosphate aldolase n=1 Tax=Cytobacillus sp. Hz8 TaxID=3347168 RepID=UPI0035E04AD8
MKKFNLDDLCRLIDHTNLKPYATREDMKKLCEEARQYHFKMVAINQVQTKYCATLLEGTDIHVGAAIGFPLGQTSIKAKVAETVDAIENGADEIDYVINLSELKEKNYDYVKGEMEQIVSICREHNVISKVIFENAYLTKDEIVKLTEIAKIVKPDFIKTSTGFAPTGATVEDVSLMKKTAGNDVKVKAAGGIRDADTFLEMIKNGAERIGCSAGIPIIEEIKKRMTNDGKDFIEI